MELKNVDAAVIGAKRTGKALARFLLQKKARVTLCDIDDSVLKDPEVGDLAKRNVKVKTGKDYLGRLEDFELIILSPGVSHKHEAIQQAHNRGIMVIGEIELAGHFIKDPIIAVTGTNGKTTTTALIGKMLKESGISVFVGGNIGTPLISYLQKPESRVVVAEISSFQLDTIDRFAPRIAVLLNISRDHLDRYTSFTDYVFSKSRIFENQSEDDFAVVNGDNEYAVRAAAGAKSIKLYFSNKKYRPATALIEEDSILISCDQRWPGRGRRSEVLLDLKESSLPGSHNRQNAAAAAMAALAAGAVPDGVQKALTEFTTLPHRCEITAEFNGVTFVNDSKATNIDAAAMSLQSFPPPVVAIMGGRHKGGEFFPLLPVLKERVKTLVLIGEAAPLMAEQIGRGAEKGYLAAKSMKEAVKKAYYSCLPRGVVLLAPACASFDMYPDYTARGDDFKKAVYELSKEVS